MIKLYNTLTRKKEEFKPIKDKKVGIYSCGPTVYWYQHIGNLRSYIFSDILKRVLEFSGYKIKHVMNITDVGHLTSDADTGEDKIEKAAKKEGKTAKEISNYYWKVFREDFKKLNIIEPDIWCKATEHIKEQIALIKKLENKGYTYKTRGGIYFDASKFKSYGILNRPNKGQEAGKRVEMKEKRNLTDFALWKFSEKPGLRQQEWESPWGVGFPGWHVECSAMSMKYLGETFDIHTGGEDHIQIHHTNEIAQSEAATGKKFVNYWLHGAFLMFHDEKISKSRGGLYTVSDLEKMGFNPLAYRYLCLTAHYRSPLDFSLDSLKSAQNALNNLKDKFLEFKADKSKVKKENIKRYRKEFAELIENDLNFPQALALTWQMIKDQKISGKEKYTLLLNFDKVFGFRLKEAKKETVPIETKKLVKEREKARESKNWQKADELRKRIESNGYIVEDTGKSSLIKKK